MNVDEANRAHIDGVVGFYLATSIADAEFFAARRWQGAVIGYELSNTALDQLHAAGAVMRPVPGGKPPYFEGQELFVPPDAFGLFNELLGRGEIDVRI